MRFTIEVDRFAEALGSIQGCLPKRSTLPILENVLVESTGPSGLKLIAYNVEREAEAFMMCEVERQGALTLNGKILSALVKRLPDKARATFELDANRDLVALSCGNSVFDLSSLPAKTFPSFRGDESERITFKMKSDDLIALFRMTNHICEEEAISRVWARGVFLSVHQDKLLALAVDGNRMSRHWVPLPKGAEGMRMALVPLATTREIVRILTGIEGDVEVVVSRVTFEVFVNDFRLSSRQIDAQLPGGYIENIDLNFEPAFRVFPVPLIEAVERVMVLKKTSKDEYFPITFEAADGKVTLSTGKVDRGREEVDADVVVPVKFRMQSRYLLDILSAWPESAEMEVQYSLARPIVFCAPKRPEIRHFAAALIK
jgi:DNA polymerase-3 subunit beta